MLNARRVRTCRSEKEMKEESKEDAKGQGSKRQQASAHMGHVDRNMHVHGEESGQNGVNGDGECAGGGNGGDDVGRW